MNEEKNNQPDHHVMAGEAPDLVAGLNSPCASLECKVISLLFDLVSDLADMGKCWYDHHGYCQEHGWLDSGICPHARAQSLFDAEGNPKPLQMILEKLEGHDS